MLLTDGVHEKPLIDLSRIILQASPTNRNELDIGANIGSYSIPLALTLSADYRFFCFEVQRQVFYQLCGNIFLNSLDNVFAFNCAVGNRNEMISIPAVDYQRCWNVGGYSIDPVTSARSGSRAEGFDQSHLLRESEPAEMVSIDSRVDLPLASLVKIDVEGHELEVIKGMEQYLRRSGYPPLIYEEWDHEWYKEKRLKTVQFLHDIGYTNISFDVGYKNFLAQHEATTKARIQLERSDVDMIKVSITPPTPSRVAGAA
jgi:FkbM family methyltransferase